MKRIWNTEYIVAVNDGPNGAQSWNVGAPPDYQELGPDYWLGLQADAS